MQRLLVASLLFSACAEDDYVQLYKDEPRAPSFTDEEIANLEHLGGQLIDQGASFNVYSEHATRIEVLLFDDPEASLPTRQFELTRFGDVWSVYIEGVGLGQHYGYIAWGPNWPWVESWFPGQIDGFVADVDSAGNRYNPNKLLIDPYTRALHRDHDWSKGSLASGPARAESTYAASAKSILVESEYVWSGHEATWRTNRQNPDWAGHGWNDTIIYEVHPKGFTAGAVDERVDHPGTYRGFGEMAWYLADLGITAVELMPVHEKPLDGGYWGYQNINFFAPEFSYATSASQDRPGAIIDEFKWMVDQLHQHGIEVILDVVYNHTGEGGFWRSKLELSDVSLDPRESLINFDPKEVAGLYSYRGLDNQAYYALNADNQEYWNDTGVGNQTRCNHRPVRQLIMDSLHYWVEEMHVDGFRFDLAPILGMKDGEYGTWDNQSNTVVGEIADDALLQQYNTRIISEPWAMGYQGFQLGNFTPSSNRADIGWSEWNGNFRDWWRSFVNNVVYDPDTPEYYPLSRAEGPVDGGAALTGSWGLFGDDGRRPYHSVNFVTAHDGFPLYDLFTYPHKQNGCGPLNPVCCSDPTSAFCTRQDGESHSRSRDWGDEAFKRQQMRNLFVGLLVAHGTPMILAGDEWMRTQLGNNNAYSTLADNPANWLDWGTWEPNAERQRMRDFVRRMIQVRKDHAYGLAPADWDQGAPFGWKTAANVDKTDWSDKQLALHYYDSSRGPQLLILINMEEVDVAFTVPTGVTWHRLVDTQSYFDTTAFFDNTGAPTRESANITLNTPEVIGGGSYTLKAYSIVILEEHE